MQKIAQQIGTDLGSDYITELMTNLSGIVGIDWKRLEEKQKDRVTQVIMTSFSEYAKKCFEAEDETTKKQMRMVAKADFDLELLEKFELKDRLSSYFQTWVKAYAEYAKSELV